MSRFRPIQTSRRRSVYRRVDPLPEPAVDPLPEPEVDPLPKPGLIRCPSQRWIRLPEPGLDPFARATSGSGRPSHHTGRGRDRREERGHARRAGVQSDAAECSMPAFRCSARAAARRSSSRPRYRRSPGRRRPRSARRRTGWRDRRATVRFRGGGPCGRGPRPTAHRRISPPGWTLIASPRSSFDDEIRPGGLEQGPRALHRQFTSANGARKALAEIVRHAAQERELCVAPCRQCGCHLVERTAHLLKLGRSHLQHGHPPPQAQTVSSWRRARTTARRRAVGATSPRHSPRRSGAQRWSAEPVRRAVPTSRGVGGMGLHHVLGDQ